MDEQISLFSYFDEIDKKVEVKEISNKDDDKSFIIGEKVKINYLGKSYIGIVKSIYNNSETINCTFDDNKRHTAFYYKNVMKIN